MRVSIEKRMARICLWIVLLVGLTAWAVLDASSMGAAHSGNIDAAARLLAVYDTNAAPAGVGEGSFRIIKANRYTVRGVAVATAEQNPGMIARIKHILLSDSGAFAAMQGDRS